MPVTRRDFIKRSAGAVAVGVVAPNLWLRQAQAQSPSSRKLVIIQLLGGNDGFNTVVPYTNSRYYALRPTLAFKESELKDAEGRSTIISGELGLHPAMSRLKELYDQGRVAIVRGVGYPNPNLSHFLSMDIWHTADTTGLGGRGWLGKYADLALFGQSGLHAAALGADLPKSFYASRTVVPNIVNFDLYKFIADPAYPADYNNQINTFRAAASRALSGDTFVGSVNRTAFESVANAELVQASVANYRSAVPYPENNPLAGALKMVAQIMTTIPPASLLYVQMGDFDHHSDQIGNRNGQPSKLTGNHARLLGWFADAVKAFYDDLEDHNLADDVLLMQWSEFGRRPEENASFGTDHGTAAPIFVIGNAVHGGLYGEQPGLAATELDLAGNVKFKVDFREVYATLLDGWLGADSRAILGASYPLVGFVG
jgi:uncharacterized protein (DUF1501 family)